MEVRSQERQADTDSRSLLSQTVRPVTLKFENVVYKIKTKPETRWLGLLGSKEGTERTILKGVSGTVRPGEMLAMLGPSGSGKTTLLTALGGRLGGKLTGTITYNGSPFCNWVKRSMGFVTQDDVLHPHLTVAETLIFTALLRLPNSMSTQEKKSNAEAVIAELGLAACRNSIVGDGFIRGCPGERKRLSVGQEMLINPSLLLLDEPTSGLDSTTAMKIVSTLSGLARAGRTVLMTIHQPSSNLYYLFHKVILLSDGHTLYFGEAAAALDYFSSIGHAPDVAMNPADFLLDLANGFSTDESITAHKTVKEALFVAYMEHLDAGVRAEAHGAIEAMEEEDDEQEEKGSHAVARQRFQTTWWQQFTILLRRGARERRHEAFSLHAVFQVVFVSILSGILWLKSDTSHLQDQVGFLFFLTSFWGFFPMFEAIFKFPDEHRMLQKERTSGMYRLSSYFMAKMVADLPKEMTLPTVFMTIAYWMSGLQHSASHFFMTLLIILSSVLVAGGFGLMLGAVTMNVKTADTLGAILMLTFTSAAGFYIQKVPAFISWVKYLSVTYHSLKLLLCAQYSPDQTYECGPGLTCRIADFGIIKLMGLDNIGINVGMLCLMFVGYRLITYLSLMRVGKTP